MTPPILTENNTSYFYRVSGLVFGVHYNEDYLAINPKGAVPALLLDDGQLLTENTVIHQYLVDERKAYALLPQVGNFQRYRILEWLNYVTTDLHKGCSPLFNPNIPDAVKEAVFKPVIHNRLSL